MEATLPHENKSSAARTAAALCFCALLVIFPGAAKQGLREGLALCYDVLVPSLFPFFFAADYLWALLRPALAKSRALCLLLCVVFSLCGGFPMGARALAQARELGAVDRRQAALLLCGCVNAGPAFLLSGVGASLFGSVRAGWLLFISLTLASLLTLALVRVCCAGAFGKTAAGPRRREAPAAPATLSASLSRATRATAGLCAHVLLFSCGGALFFRLLGFTNVRSDFFDWLVRALCEVSSACAFAARIGSTKGLFLALGAVSLCGGCVFLQLRAQAPDLSLLPLLLSRPLHLLLSAGILKALLSLSPQAPVFAPSSAVTARLFRVSPELSFFLFLLAFILVGGRRPAGEVYYSGKKYYNEQK